MAVVSDEGPLAQSLAAAEPWRCGVARPDYFVSDTGADESGSAALFCNHAAGATRSCPAAELCCGMAGSLAACPGGIGAPGEAGATLERAGVLVRPFHRRGYSPAAPAWTHEYT